MEQLSQRQTSILKGVVETHIETSLPVGSKAISERYSFSFSPATIRSEMGLLEDKGYLMHPHTSSGRIPTDHGYRYYLDHTALMDPLPRNYFSRMAEELSEEAREEEIEFFLDHVSSLLSAMSREVGLTLLPFPEQVGVGRRSGRLKLSLQGITHILEKPEFQDVGKARVLLGVFEEKKTLSQCLLKRTGEEPVSVSVGQEHGYEALEDCAIVTARYTDGKNRTGAIAILGPKRMPYREVIPMVFQMASMVGNILEQVAFEDR